MSADYFESTYGANALSWIRAARTASGSQVTTGTIAVLSDGSFRYTPGGSTLKLSKPGFSGELRVNALTGDISSSNFPRAGESIDVSWLFADGKSARCVLKQDERLFDGTFLDEHGDEAQVRATWFRTSDGGSYADPYGVHVTFTYGTVDAAGELTSVDGRDVSFAMHGKFATCITGGTGCYLDRFDYQYTHDVSLRLDSSIWNLNTSYWGGTIDGPTEGRFVVRPIGQVFALDVRVGEDSFSVDSALEVAE